MDTLFILPPLQAGLNTLAASLMLGALYFIRKKNQMAHRAMMLGAIFVSAIFLVSYLIYHLRVGYVPFKGEGLIRPLYFTILTTHILTAAMIVPLVLVTLFFSFKRRFNTHRRVARWTLPLWVYTSVTGVVVYLLAFHIYAA